MFRVHHACAPDEHTERKRSCSLQPCPVVDPPGLQTTAMRVSSKRVLAVHTDECSYAMQSYGHHTGVTFGGLYSNMFFTHI